MCSCGGVAAGQTHMMMASRKDGLIIDPSLHQSLSGNSIYSSGPSTATYYYN